MGDENYDRIVRKIASSAGLEQEEIERRVEAKRAKLAGLISKEGAAQVIAAELGINFDNERLKLDELLPGMRKVNTIGKVINVFPVRTYKNNKGVQSKVANLILADETSNVKVVLWDTNHIELFERGQLGEGSVIEICNGSVRMEEIHLGSFSELKLCKEKIENVKTEKVVKEKGIADLKVGDNVRVRAFIVQSFEPKFFEVCPECKKGLKLSDDGKVCLEHGKVAPERRALINIVLDDGTETLHAVLFSEGLTSLGLTSLEDSLMLAQQRENLLGRELVFLGNIRQNKFFDRPEFSVNSVEEINLDSLIVKLER